MASVQEIEERKVGCAAVCLEYSVKGRWRVGVGGGGGLASCALTVHPTLGHPSLLTLYCVFVSHLLPSNLKAH